MTAQKPTRISIEFLMKRFALVVAFILIAFTSLAQHTPIFNGLLQSGLNGNQQPITNLNSINISAVSGTNVFRADSTTGNDATATTGSPSKTISNAVFLASQNFAVNHSDSLRRSGLRRAVADPRPKRPCISLAWWYEYLLFGLELSVRLRAILDVLPLRTSYRQKFRIRRHWW